MRTAGRSLLRGFSQFEREIMLERQAEGIDKAKAEGKYKGRKATARMKAPEIVALFQTKQTVAEIVRTTGTASGSSVETTLNALDAFG